MLNAMRAVCQAHWRAPVTRIWNICCLTVNYNEEGKGYMQAWCATSRPFT